jgi:glycosyltransferase involved in cell wall biosynthesis
MPSYFRLLYFGLVKGLSHDVTGGKEYDVAVDFSSYRNECAVGAILAHAKKRVMWIHNDVEIKRKNEPKYRILWHFFKGKLRFYDAFAAVSPGIIEGFRRATGITDKPIMTIPNHIDTDEIFRKVTAPVDLSVDENVLNLCSVGRICHQKAYDVLMEYLAELKKTRPAFHFYLIGDGPDRAALEQQIKSLGLSENVTLLGNQPNPFPYMDKMDGFVLCSRYEGQGMVIWEAKALGLPLYISKNLEAYNPGITGCEDMVAALRAAQKPRKKTYDDLHAYNAAISESIRQLLEL